LKIIIKSPNDIWKIGVSKECGSLKHLSSALEEAVYAENIGSYLDSKSIYFYDDYFVYHVISKLNSNPTVRKIYGNIIDKIRNESGSNKEEIIKTLKVLVNNDFNITKASNELFIHRNSLYKRIEKIEKITGYDFNHPDTKFIFQMVSKLDDLIN